MINVVKARAVMLPMIYFLLDGASGQQSIDSDRSRLTNTPRPLPGLSVSARVPVWVEYDDSISTGQVDAKSTDASRQQEQKQ